MKNKQDIKIVEAQILYNDKLFLHNYYTIQVLDRYDAILCKVILYDYENKILSIGMEGGEWIDYINVNIKLTYYDI